ncbi:unnamed protein product [marine sediment metagenome]|uniref:Uncharacterized protein n=1 Tax=marine sediment metagenome TaxID=412755 RepID=X1RBV8_9ZZZZ
MSSRLNSGPRPASSPIGVICLILDLDVGLHKDPGVVADDLNGVIKLEVFWVILLEAELNVASPQPVLHAGAALDAYLLQVFTKFSHL